MRKKLIVVCGNDPQYLGRVFQLIEMNKDSNSSPIVLDLSRINPKIGNGYQPRLLKLFRISSPTESFHQAIRIAGIEMIYPNFRVTESQTKIASEEIEQILDACESAIISYSRNATPNLELRRFRKFYDELYVGALHSWEVVNHAIESFDVSEVFIPNGRFPHQRAAIMVAQSANVHINYYEKGDYSESIYIQTYYALDRIESQKRIADFLKNFDQENIEIVGKKWLEDRMPSEKGTSLNAYASNFDDARNTSLKNFFSETEWIGIFTSSQDEFASLGKEWHLHEWSDQYSAISAVLKQVGMAKPVYLRIHPNFATKSHEAYKRELDQINLLRAENPHLHVFMHDDPVNSYDLIRNSSHIVVWDSTIGLEAMMLGKNVTELAPSFYDEYTELSRCFSEKDLRDVFDRKVIASPTKAIEFAAYLSLRETPLTASALELVEKLDVQSGYRKKVLQLFSAGGNPSTYWTCIYILDTLRHRGARYSIRHFLRWRKFISR